MVIVTAPQSPFSPLPPILPPGTQVVCQVEMRGTDGRPVHPRGAVGVIIQSPADFWHSYRVKFLDGFEAALKRSEMEVLSHFQKTGIEGDAGPREGALAEYSLQDCVIYRCIVGSRAYGLDDAGSDTDLRGIYLPPADRQWSLFGVPEQLENPVRDEVYWELQKFLTLALKANPNILECLYTPLIEYVTPLAQELLAMRDAFVSKLVYQTYSGYVASQFKKQQADLRNKGNVKWKHVMHLIRLLLAGIGTLREGRVPVHTGEHREKLLAIRRGEIPLQEIELWRADLHREFDDALQTTALPDRPDYVRANAFLLKARRSAFETMVVNAQTLTTPTQR
jgi:predicted nucleotidyltransferase